MIAWEKFAFRILDPSPIPNAVCLEENEPYGLEPCELELSEAPTDENNAPVFIRI